MTTVRAPSLAGMTVYSWPFGVGLGELFRDALWIVFFIGASSAPHPLDITNVERYFWFPADLAVAVVAVAHKNELFELARKHAIFLTWPALACLSVIWSFTPSTSLYHGIQLLMTILVGLVLCQYASLERIMQQLFGALLICAVLSLLYAVAKGQTGGEWMGVFPHKNVLGHMMCILIITGVCLFLMGWRPLVTGCGVILAFGLLYLSRSGTSLIALSIAFSVLPVAVALRLGPFALSIMIGLTLIVGAAFWLAIEVSDVDLVSAVLGLLGKDETLTGRTLLWDFGIDAFYSRPWLGFGYKGYWDSPDTPALLLRTVIGQDLWFFHNNILDVAVAFGVIGPVLLAAGLVAAFVTAIKRVVSDRGYAALWALLYVVFVTVLCTAENPLFQNHSLHQLLLIVAVAGTAQRRRPPLGA